jgi:hypothetical protein
LVEKIAIIKKVSGWLSKMSTPTGLQWLSACFGLLVGTAANFRQ